MGKVVVMILCKGVGCEYTPQSTNCMPKCGPKLMTTPGFCLSRAYAAACAMCAGSIRVLALSSMKRAGLIENEEFSYYISDDET